MTERNLLLVDDEENILRALTRLLRRDGYTIFSAASGVKGLALMEEHQFGVILSDQRMPEMPGSEFLEQAKSRQPDSIRLMLSGYTDLESVTDAINRGAIYKFLTKPWDDELLRDNVRQAFEQHELRGERDRLARALQDANAQLAQANQGLEQQVASQDRALTLQTSLLELSRDILEHLPVGVIGISEEGEIALANEMAHRILARPSGSLLDHNAREVLPPELNASTLKAGESCQCMKTLAESDSRALQIHCTRLDDRLTHSGGVLVLIPKDELS